MLYDAFKLASLDGINLNCRLVNNEKLGDGDKKSVSPSTRRFVQDGVARR